MTEGRDESTTTSLSFMQTLSCVKGLLSFGHPPVWTLFVSPTTVIASAALGALPPLFVGRIIDALQHHDARQTLRQLLLYVCVMLACGLIGLIASYTSSVFRESLAQNLQLFLFAKLNRSRLRVLSELAVGQITGRILGDIRSLVTQLDMFALPALSSTCAVLTTVIVMLRLEWRLAIVAMLCSLIVLVPMRITRPKLVGLQRQFAFARDDFYGAISESTSIAGLIANKNTSAFRRAMHSITLIGDRIRRLQIATAVTGSLAAAASMVAGMIGPVTVLAIGAYLVARGQMTVGTMVSLLIYQSRLSTPIGTFSGMQLTIATIAVTAQRILEVAELPEENGGSKEFAPGDVSMRQVSLTVGDRNVLAAVDLHVPQGQHIGLVGPSGSGKTSLATLLLRLHDPSAGEIAIGSNPISEFKLKSLRDSVCIVSQDPFILDASLLDNIALNRDACDIDSVERAIDAVFLRDFVNKLPKGLGTELGQRGFRMSGGERQRVCVARALVQGPQLLILDEALTGVELDMERHILREIRRLFFGRTLVVITHRLDSIRELDAVIIMDGGTVVAHGSPDLLSRNEHIRRLTEAWGISGPATTA